VSTPEASVEPAPAPAPAPLPRRPAAGVAALAGGLRAAVALLTRAPVGRAPISAAARGWAAAWFPLVGLGLGALGAGVLHLAAPRLGGLVAAALAVAAVALVTGALHEDGLADTADALGGAAPGDRERLFAILKDSRIGSYGAVALVLALLLRVAALERLGLAAPAAFVLAQLASRLPAVWLMAALPYVTPAAVARSGDGARAGVSQVVFATVLAGAIAAALVAGGALPVLPALATAAVTIAVFAFTARWFAARAGGITGDFLGASQQLTEIGALLAAAAVW
jgi:adenosylcobinamide-GDP ribazoletransferase